MAEESGESSPGGSSEIAACPNGHQQPQMARFCQVCGSEMEGSPSPVLTPADDSSAGTRSSARNRLVIVGAAVVAAAVLVVGAVVASSTSSGGGAEEVEMLEEELASLEARIAAVKSSTTQAPPSTGAPTTESSPEMTAPTTTAPPAKGSWIAVVASIPAGRSDTDAKVAEVLSGNPGLRSLVSDDYASLGAGYIVVYSGTFVSSSEAISSCYEMGRTTKNECYAAVLSQDPADRSNRVYPD